MASMYKYIIASFIFIFFSFSGLKAQNEITSLSDSIKVKQKAISLNNISDETERIGQRISDLKETLKPSIKIIKVDSILNNTYKDIILKKDSLLIVLDKMNRRELKASLIEWNNYRSQIKEYQKILKTRAGVISEINDEIVKESEKWRQTKKELSKISDSEKIYAGLDPIISTLQDILSIAHERLDNIFIIQKKLTSLVLNIDDIITEIKLAEQQLQKDYFAFDSQPIWKSHLIGPAKIDSLNSENIPQGKIIQSNIEKNTSQIKEFLSSNIKTVLFQIIFIVLLFILIVLVNKRWMKRVDELTNPIEIQSKIILSHPVSATIVSGVLISAFFYTALIPVFAEIHIFLILLATVYLLPKLTDKRFSLFLILIFISYFIQTFESYLGINSSILRWLSIIDAIILISALATGRKIMISSPEQFKPIYKLFIAITPVYIVILSGAILANVFGMVSLSRFLIKGVLISTALGMVVFLTVKVIISLVILFFKLRRSYSIQALSNMVNATHRRILPILYLAGFLVWIMFSLKGFEIYNFIVSWFDELMTIQWDIGEMTISLGGLLAFLGIFIITLILSKLTATIFQDDWMINVLPRGIAPAISLILRIILISIGLYMALSAAGLDLSKLGFMLGALGVGIGFGLQNIVLNFVAGLILAFERPINLGDTIEIDQEFGIVTNIGVRSSNIKSYSGYEAIIPNGDLISKKVINYTLTNRDRRSKIIMKTAPNADPEKVIELFNKIAIAEPNTQNYPAPNTYFYGYDPDGNLSFALIYWTTFSDTLKTDSDIALNIFSKLKEEGIDPPIPARRIIHDK